MAKNASSSSSSSSSSGSSGFGLHALLKSKAKGGRLATEAQLLQQAAAGAAITPDDVLALAAPTSKYLCPTTANVYGIEFTGYTLREPESGTVLFHVEKPADLPYVPPSADDDDSGRFIQYRFSPEFFDLRTLGASVKFRVGEQAIRNFRMVERHFFGKKLLKTFDFDFGFVIPESENTCEHLYEFPRLSEADKEDMIAKPFETKSDSFYFVDGKLVMHHRAEYAYDA